MAVAVMVLLALVVVAISGCMNSEKNIETVTAGPEGFVLTFHTEGNKNVGPQLWDFLADGRPASINVTDFCIYGDYHKYNRPAD